MKLQHWSYRICSRIVHGPFLKESCRVLSYKSKIDLTGAHCRWILKMKVRSTYFHRFSVFSNICCCQFLFVVAPFWIFYSESTWRWSPRRPNLQIISTSSEASNFRTSFVHVGTSHVKLRIRLLDHIGSYWIMLKTSDIQLAVWLPKIDYCLIASFLHFCMLQSFLLGESLFSVGSFRNPSNNCVGQDVRSNIDQPSTPSTRSTI